MVKLCVKMGHVEIKLSDSGRLEINLFLDFKLFHFLDVAWKETDLFKAHLRQRRT